MTCTSRVDPDTGIAYLTVQGPTPLEEALNELLEAWKTPGYTWRMVIEVEEDASVPDWSSDSLDRIMAFMTTRRPAGAPRGRGAYVAKTAIAFGVMRMVQAHAHNYDVDAFVCRTVGDAVTWLEADG